jgi:tetratricopeptide (TPR) repeat protein
MGALQGASSQSCVLTRVLAAAGWHARIIAWPFDLMPKYLDPAGGPSMVTLAVGGVVIVVVLALTVFAAVRRHPAFIGLALAVLAYAPQSGVLPLSRQYANSYVYLMQAGFVLAAAAWLAPLAGRAAGWVKGVMAVVSVAVVVAFGAASHVQEGVYRDGVTLWANMYKAYPDSPQVCRNLGNAFIYGDRDEPEKAAAAYERCIETLGDRPFFLKNLAVARFRAGQVDQARALFMELEDLRPGDPVARKYLKMLNNQ